jgi:hypothetical protein
MPPAGCQIPIGYALCVGDTIIYRPVAERELHSNRETGRDWPVNAVIQDLATL